MRNTFRTYALLLLGAFVLACTEEAAEPDGYLLQITMPSNFNRALISEVQIVFDTAPGGGSLGLTQTDIGPEMTSQGMRVQTQVRNVDRDSDLEYVIRVLQNPFASTSFFQFFLVSPGYQTAKFSVRVNLVGRQGLLSSVVATQTPTGDSLYFGNRVKAILSVAPVCTPNLSCITEGQANRAPVLATIASKTINVRQERTLNIALAAYDPDGDAITFSVDQTMLDTLTGATMEPISGVFTWTPPTSAVRDAPWQVTFMVADSNGATDEETVSIKVVATNSDPVWTPVVDQVAVEGQTLSIQLDATDPDGETLTFALDKSGLPTGADAAFDATTKTFSWTPTSADGREAPYTAKLTATDSNNASTELTLSIQVVDVNASPSITAPDSLAVKAGALATLQLAVTDADGDTVTVAADLSALLAGNDAAYNDATRTFTWTPGAGDIGATAWTVTFTATDGRGGSTVKKVGFVVTVDNAAPVFAAVSSKSVVEEQVLSFAVTATDPESDAITLAVDPSGLPVGSTVTFTTDGGAGTFGWTPKTGEARSESYVVKFTATDSNAAATTLDVLIGVTAKPTAADAGAVADAGADAGGDAGGDADAGGDVDAGGDAGADADAGTDAGVDADAGADAGMDAGEDAGPDTTPPTVLSTSPAHDAGGIGIYGVIELLFSEPVAANTVTAGNIFVNSGGVIGALSVDGGLVTFTPTSFLSYGTTYTTLVTTGLRDLASNALASAYSFGFTTRTAPSVSSTSPTNYAVSVSTSATISATFGEQMDASTITNASFLVNDGGVAGTIGYSGTTATFTPSSALAAGALHAVKLTTAIRTASGDPLASDYTWSFTTATPDTTPPTVSNTCPLSASPSVCPCSAVKVTFSEAVNASTIGVDTFRVENMGSPISGFHSVNGSTVTWSGTNAPPLPPSVQITVRLTTGIQDLAGNSLQSEYTWNFFTTTPGFGSQCQ